MSELIQNETKRKKEKAVTDKAGHYDLDGTTQTDDCEVIVAGDKTRSNKPIEGHGLKNLKLKFKRWASEWDDEHP